MNRKDIIQLTSDFMGRTDQRFIPDGSRAPENPADTAPGAGFDLFDAPLFAVGSATDPLWLRLKDPSVIGDHFLLPTDWLPAARSVVSIFLPFSQAVRESNRAAKWPSPEWLHGRIEGQAFISRMTRHLVDTLGQAGHRCVAPSLDARFRSGMAAGSPATPYTSNWSERHVAYVCGMGTFGLSRGLITRRGMAGRFTSLVTDLELEPDARPYNRYDEYCTRCGACVINCPVGAIALESGKDHRPCSAFLDHTMERFRPRYGCGKCQVSVPCEAGIPNAGRDTPE